MSVQVKESNGSPLLYVKNKPFLMLAGELQNSSLTSAEYMDTVWDKMARTNYNTLLGAVTWEDIEPEEGKFCFDELDRVIEGARKHDMHLVLLWFGSFKNALSTYAPGWVKKDHKRFPRAHVRAEGGKMRTLEALSVFSPESTKADCKAFAKLTAHLKEFDGEHATVLMIQVENETGMLGDSRDFSSLATKQFRSEVPKDFISYLRTNKSKLHPTLTANLKYFEEAHLASGTWEEVFGVSEQTDEIFMAYHFSKYVEAVAAAGAENYSIPLYTNVWMNYVGDDNDFPVIVGGGGRPGDYPCGGAVSNTLDIWKANAKSLNFIAPDIYLNNYSETYQKYRHNGNVLFIPEQRRDAFGARRVWESIGTYSAIGASPFGVDTVEPEECPYTEHYGLLKTVSPLIFEAREKGQETFGFYFDEPGPKCKSPNEWVFECAGYRLTVKRSFVFGKQDAGYGMIIHKGSAKFLFIGKGFAVYYKSLDPKATFTGILYFQEKRLDSNGELVTVRRLNGDETRSGVMCLMPNDNPDYGGFPICVTIPAATMVAESQPYHLTEDLEDY